MEIIRVEGLYKSFGSHQVLRDINFSIDSDRLLIIGRSGMGKSVLIKSIVRLLEPDRGRVFLNGVEVTSLSERQLEELWREVGFLFQSGALFDYMNVEENILFVLENVRGITGDKAKKRVKEVLEMVGLPNVGNKMPSELSGGMRKRVALARTISTYPSILFLDEPTTGLDPITSDYVISSVIELKDYLGIPIVVVTHDVEVMKKISGKVIMIENSQIVFFGDFEDMIRNGNEYIRQFLNGLSEGPINVV
ncbi:MAG: ATP-binding cassette domain-containing protein [Spirochaetia bacterium]|nr:ATP-binding cassette domain-containing protein [Spirochaetota bacterium]MDW8112230.1 ATP-binding cassette domain-containing protein [Spirochaetia bacterium]